MSVLSRIAPRRSAWKVLYRRSQQCSREFPLYSRKILVAFLIPKLAMLGRGVGARFAKSVHLAEGIICHMRELGFVAYRPLDGRRKVPAGVWEGGRNKLHLHAERVSEATSLGSIRLWLAKRRHDGLTDGLGSLIVPCG